MWVISIKNVGHINQIRRIKTFSTNSVKEIAFQKLAPKTLSIITDEINQP